MIATRGETFEVVVFSRKPNSKYEYEETPYTSFFARPANAKEKKNYRIQTGIHGNSESLYLYATNMPKEIKPEDKLVFNGTRYTVESIGYYYDDSRIVNNSIMSPSYIEQRCPKGITLK